MNRILLALALCALLCSGCVGASSVGELKRNPGGYLSVKSKYGYQESLRIVKDEYAALLGYDLSCTIFSDMKVGECTFTNTHGVAVTITSKCIDENSALVDFYAAVSWGRWEKNFNHLASKLQ